MLPSNLETETAGITQRPQGFYKAVTQVIGQMRRQSTLAAHDYVELFRFAPRPSSWMAPSRLMRMSIRRNARDHGLFVEFSLFRSPTVRACRCAHKNPVR